MPNDFTSVDIWVGLFTSADVGQAVFEYVEERDSHWQDGRVNGGVNDSAPISQLAEDMGESFIDHDFLCTMWISEPTNDIRHLLLESLITNQFGDPNTGEFGEAFIAARYLEQRSDAVNAMILVYGDEVQNPKSVTGTDHWLHYVGRFYEQR
jgi:Immunity protein 22